MDETIVLPDLKTGTYTRQHVQAMRSVDGRLIVIMLAVVRSADVAAEIEKVDVV
jgi:hypothetical protein